MYRRFQMEEGRVRIAFNCEKGLSEIADAYLAKANVKSRNDFINMAVRHYIAFLQKENDNEFLTPALESVLDGKLGSLENRLAGIVFKLAVEVSMMLHVTASGAGIPEDDIDRLRAMCVEEVKRVNGKISFEKAYRHQKG
jgi:metal-responsive CopG/Arc/MetJ family transcriptional regulator